MRQATKNKSISAQGQGRFVRAGTALAVSLALAWPGTVVLAEEYNNPADPWEGYNRGVFAVNKAVDSAVVKPVAKGYEFLIPEPIRILVTNFFSNLGDVVIGVNDLLQGRGEQALHDFGRVLMNTTLGFGGLFDVASNTGIYKNDNDFGVTFARWGADSGPYFMLPILGPSTVRDSFGTALGLAASPLNYIIKDPTAYYIALGVNFINTRANLLPAEKVIEEAATDEYSFLRDAYLQNRQNLIYDGEPPKAKDDDAADATSTSEPAAQTGVAENSVGEKTVVISSDGRPVPVNGQGIAWTGSEWRPYPFTTGSIDSSPQQLSAVTGVKDAGNDRVDRVQSVQSVQGVQRVESQ